MDLEEIGSYLLIDKLSDLNKLEFVSINKCVTLTYKETVLKIPNSTDFHKSWKQMSIDLKKDTNNSKSFDRIYWTFTNHRF